MACVFDPKNLPKTLPKRGPNPLKIDAENGLFFNIDFFASRPRFWKLLDFRLATKSAALLAAPGVLKPTAFYACINILLFLTRGGPGVPRPSSMEVQTPHVGAMLAHFSLLVAFLFVLGRSYVFFGHFWCILAVFCGFWNAPDSIFGSIFGHCVVISAESPAGIHLLLLFVSTCSAAVRAKHIRRLPKGEPCVPDINHSSSLYLPLRHAFRIRLQIPSSKAFPHPFVPSPGPARTAALRPQFALEASQCDFLAFQKSSYFLLPFFLEKKCKNHGFWPPQTLPKCIQNAFKIDVPQNLHFFIDFLLILVVFGFVRFFLEVLKT